MNIYTIGFAQKSAKEFFELLEKNSIDCLIDIRLNNISQLAGFTKGKDLEYFLNKILAIKYIHDINYAPTKEILDAYKKKTISWIEYEKQYMQLIEKRNVEVLFKKTINNNFNNICLLCSEPEARYCHRRLLGDYLKHHVANIRIKHI
ncbi:MAG: DUF488 domain-containing protein [Cyanobacteria bacterium SIG32]|nr:DUF488 domain-containing protein [Cyanobacteria bacterium SIG32]